MTRFEYVLRNQAFKSVVMSGDNPIRVAGGLDEFHRHWGAGYPEVHWLVIDRIAETHDLGAW